jgi:ANTAR domain/GAF domain
MVTETSDEDTEDFIQLQDALVNTENIEQFLHEMVVLAARLVGSDLSCGMTIRANGRPQTVACSDPLAAKVDAVQYELDNGPCLHAMRDGHMVKIEDTTDKARWPEFETRAASQGVRSCLALPLTSRDQRVGALNLYGRRASAFGAEQARRAVAFARNASGALTLAIRLASRAAVIEQLRSSLVSRTVIDQALGIVMAREGCTQARAFDILRTTSQNSNVKLRDIAGAIVTSVSGEPPQPPEFQTEFQYDLSLRGIPVERLAGLVRLSIQAGERGGHVRIDVDQAIHAGKGQYPPHRQGPDDQAHGPVTGLGPPERAD